MSPGPNHRRTTRSFTSTVSVANKAVTAKTIAANRSEGTRRCTCGGRLRSIAEIIASPAAPQMSTTHPICVCLYRMNSFVTRYGRFQNRQTYLNEDSLEGSLSRLPVHEASSRFNSKFPLPQSHLKLLSQRFVRWCNGNTAPFGGVIHGSNPCRTATP